MTYPARIDGKPHFYPNEYIRVPPMGGARYLLKSQTYWCQGWSSRFPPIWRESGRPDTGGC